MSVSSVSSAGCYDCYQPKKAASEKPGESYNQKAQVDEQNAKTGGDYDIDKEAAARNAELVLNITV